MLVLTINVGSSSLKSAVFEITPAVARRVLTASITTDATRTVAAVATGDGSPTSTADIGLSKPTDGIGWLLARLEHDGLADDVVAVGHRLVHGGLRYRAPVWLDAAVISDLRQLVPLAPDHLPTALAAVDAIGSRWPAIRQSAAFDTAFHANLPNRAKLFGLPRAIADAGVVRFGFHGLSYEYIVGELRASQALRPRIVIAHLGSGASLAAVRDGESIDTTMGFTPTGGIIMATRSGDLDPGVLLYLARTRGLGPDMLSRLVNIEGGLAGLSGTTGDMRTLLDQSPTMPAAGDAVDVFCYQVSKAIAALTAALGGLDTIVFSGGIGEHIAVVRHRVCERLAWCGVTLDANRNAAHAAVISAAGASVMVRIVPTNEELMVARHLHALIQQGGNGAN